MGDDFESLYKGEISKSGTPILPSKRARKTPEKIQVSQEDIAEVANPDISVSTDETTNEKVDVALDDASESEDKEEANTVVSATEDQEAEVNTEDSDTSNS